MSKRTMKTRLPAMAAFGALVLTQEGAAAAEAKLELSLTGQPRSWVVEGNRYTLQGYRGARWGMEVEQVKAFIAAEHPDALATLQDKVDPVARTRTLAVTVLVLQPGPGPATISYVFGAASQRLVGVHLVWSYDGNPSAAQRVELVQAATTLATGLIGYRWAPLSATRGMVAGPGALIVFSGRDDRGRGLEVRLDGVAMDVERPGKPGRPVHRASAPGPARLRYSMAASLGQPDVCQIPLGSF